MNSPSTTTALPSAWIERLFARFLTLYGRKFADQWGCVDADELKAAWAYELRNVKAEQIALALERCKGRPFPPTLPEFIDLCGHGTIGHEAAFVEAAMRWPSREGWSEPAIYWAAAGIGNDVKRLAYTSIKARWVAALDRARANPQPIPAEVSPTHRIEYAEDTQESSAQARERVMGWWRSLGHEDKRRQQPQDETIAAD